MKESIGEQLPNTISIKQQKTNCYHLTDLHYISFIYLFNTFLIYKIW